MKKLMALFSIITILNSVSYAESGLADLTAGPLTNQEVPAVGAHILNEFSKPSWVCNTNYGSFIFGSNALDEIKSTLESEQKEGHFYLDAKQGIFTLSVVHAPTENTPAITSVVSVETTPDLKSVKSIGLVQAQLIQFNQVDGDKHLNELDYVTYVTSVCNQTEAK